ncbi:MAG: hypothetical protein ABSB41_07455 [Anaerolineales bacterium]
MKKIAWIVLFLVLGNACSLTAPIAAPTAAPTTVPTSLPSPSPLPLPTSTPAFTATPVLTPTETVTPTLSTPMVEAVNHIANCRFGPGEDYLPVGTFPPNQWVPIDASTGDQSWWRIELPNTTTYCWISNSITQTSGDLSQVNVVRPPGGLAIGATVSGEGEVIGPCSGSNTNHFTGTLTINGPGEILYVWEIYNAAGDRLAKSSTYSLIFHTSETLAVSPWSFSGGCGNYVVDLKAFNPNTFVATFSYKAVP